jgi:hypothetical protein
MRKKLTKSLTMGGKIIYRDKAPMAKSLNEVHQSLQKNEGKE